MTASPVAQLERRGALRALGGGHRRRSVAASCSSSLVRAPTHRGVAARPAAAAEAAVPAADRPASSRRVRCLSRPFRRGAVPVRGRSGGRGARPARCHGPGWTAPGLSRTGEPALPAGACRRGRRTRPPGGPRSGSAPVLVRYPPCPARTRPARRARPRGPGRAGRHGQREPSRGASGPPARAPPVRGPASTRPARGRARERDHPAQRRQRVRRPGRSRTYGHAAVAGDAPRGREPPGAARASAPATGSSLPMPVRAAMPGARAHDVVGVDDACSCS